MSEISENKSVQGQFYQLVERYTPSNRRIGAKEGSSSNRFKHAESSLYTRIYSDNTNEIEVPIKGYYSKSNVE